MDKEKFCFISDLIKSQKELLLEKDDILSELYDLCDDEEQRNLVKQLLINFSLMDEDVYNLCLKDMSNNIVNRGYSLDECLLVATAHDHLPDSSQSVLQDIKFYMELAGFPSDNYCNRFDRCLKKRDFQSIRHFFILDDFVGSGSTLQNRKDEFESKMAQNGRECSLHFVVASGMRFAVDQLRELGIDVFCAYNMNRAISESFLPSEVEHKIQLMSYLESKLATIINETELSDYHLGYKQSEALFCRKSKNVPNNVFPIFWWKRYADNSDRKTLFIRSQSGY